VLLYGELFVSVCSRWRFFYFLVCIYGLSLLKCVDNTTPSHSSSSDRTDPSKHNLVSSSTLQDFAWYGHRALTSNFIAVKHSLALWIGVGAKYDSLNLGANSTVSSPISCIHFALHRVLKTTPQYLVFGKLADAVLKQNETFHTGCNKIVNMK
jgi:hypothetical protein